MGFVAETGQGLEDANSYASVQQFKDFAALRPRIVVPDTDAKIQGGLVEATDWIDATFAINFKGERLLVGQALEWPRGGIAEPNGYVNPAGMMPSQVVKATCILAVEAFNGALFKNVDPTAIRQVIEKQTGPLVTKYNPIDPRDYTVQLQFDEVRQTLAPLLRSWGMLKVSR